MRSTDNASDTSNVPKSADHQPDMIFFAAWLEKKFRAKPFSMVKTSQGEELKRILLCRLTGPRLTLRFMARRREQA
jgi:hypothetical protein